MPESESVGTDERSGRCSFFRATISTLRKLVGEEGVTILSSEARSAQMARHKRMRLRAVYVHEARRVQVGEKQPRIVDNACVCCGGVRMRRMRGQNAEELPPLRVAVERESAANMNLYPRKL